MNHKQVGSFQGLREAISNGKKAQKATTRDQTLPKTVEEK